MITLKKIIQLINKFISKFLRKRKKMPALERFFSPSVRYFTSNIRSLPGALLYFTAAGSSTPKVVYQDKAGQIEHEDPVEADPNGIFPPIFLDGLYKAELKSAAGITQPGWPIDNVGQDSQIVPFGPWQETITYSENELVTAPSTGDWYRSKADDNLGNEPTANPSDWELIIIPLAANFTSDEAWVTWADVAGQISLNIDVNAMRDAINLSAVKAASTDRISTTTLVADPDLIITGLPAGTYWVKAFLYWQGNGSTLNGIKVAINSSSGVVFGAHYVATTNTSSTNLEPVANNNTHASTSFSKLPNDGAPETILIDVTMTVAANASVYVEWAQVASTATNTSLIGTSCLIVTKV